MQIQTKAVHSGDRKKLGAHIPVTTPIYTASAYSYPTMEQLDRVFNEEEKGPAYARYETPSAEALESLIAELENAPGAQTCASGMAALHLAILTALTDRRRSVVAANAMYGATTSMLMNVLEPSGVQVTFADPCAPAPFRAAVEEARPGCILVESISNPLLRVCPLDEIAAIARQNNAALIVDNTFATPLIVRPLELGAHFSVHSLTKYLAGHGDVMGGAIAVDSEHLPILRGLSRTLGPALGPFECYLAMRGIKTFPLRMERQCDNARRIAAWLAAHPRISRVYFTNDPEHPDAAVIRRLFPESLTGAIVSFEIKDAARGEVFRFMDALRLIVRATSLGDVHTMMLYPPMSTHRDISPKQRERMGIRENLVRLSAGIEAVEDVIADLDQALT